MRNNTHGMKACGPRIGTIASDIERYVFDHPECTKAAIIAATGVGMNTVSMTLTRLRAVGLVKKTIKVHWDGKRRKNVKISYWSHGIEDGVKLLHAKESIEGQPRQKIVTKWITPKFQQDPITAALFGLKQQDQQGELVK